MTKEMEELIGHHEYHGGDDSSLGSLMRERHALHGQPATGP